MTLSPDQLLAGPRGRRLCLEFAARAGENRGGIAEELRLAVFYASYDLDPGKGRSVVMMTASSFDTTDEAEQTSASATLPDPSPENVARLLDTVPLAEPDDRVLMLSLAAAVDSARYWQEPDGSDVLAATPVVRAALERVAATIVAARSAGWWREALDTNEQWKVTFTETASFAPETPSSATEILTHWRTAQLNEERDAARERPADPTANWGGTWWSKPPSALTRTTRALATHGPAGLLLVEDALGWQSATANRIDIPHDLRIYEIDGPDAWAELCARYPMVVTASRRHDWYRTTGRDAEWLIPDWTQVQQSFDAVHLTVGGYLATAGRAIDVGDGRATVLAGWDPDQTYWLRDVACGASSAQHWIFNAEDDAWEQTPGGGDDSYSC
jgi:hypothetical protein